MELAAASSRSSCRCSPFLYNGDEPTLFGFPRFYWLQLAFIVLGVGTTTLVYQMTKKRR